MSYLTSVTLQYIFIAVSVLDPRLERGPVVLPVSVFCLCLPAYLFVCLPVYVSMCVRVMEKVKLKKNPMSLFNGYSSPALRL